QSFGNMGIFAGRDNGLSIHGDIGGGKFKWAYGAFEGLNNTGADQTDNFATANVQRNAPQHFHAPVTGAHVVEFKDNFGFRVFAHGAGSSTPR
ncbi:MAG: hypothetical protein QF541_20210, partial [Lentisphaeria bacterium]|nr:hypothetical protein [Lentisphaeria bacterium]